jgi:hypothetical protein
MHTEFESLVFDYVPTDHRPTMRADLTWSEATRLHGDVVITDYATWHDGMAPLNAGPGKPVGHYIGRIAKTEQSFWYATPDDGNHNWDQLKWRGAFTSRRDAALWLAGYAEALVRSR